MFFMTSHTCAILAEKARCCQDLVIQFKTEFSNMINNLHQEELNEVYKNMKGIEFHLENVNIIGVMNMLQNELIGFDNLIFEYSNTYSSGDIYLKQLNVTFGQITKECCDLWMQLRYNANYWLQFSYEIDYTSVSISEAYIYAHMSYNFNINQGKIIFNMERYLKSRGKLSFEELMYQINNLYSLNGGPDSYSGIVCAAFLNYSIYSDKLRELCYSSVKDENMGIKWISAVTTFYSHTKEGVAKFSNLLDYTDINTYLSIPHEVIIPYLNRFDLPRFVMIFAEEIRHIEISNIIVFDTNIPYYIKENVITMMPINLQILLFLPNMIHLSGSNPYLTYDLWKQFDEIIVVGSKVDNYKNLDILNLPYDYTKYIAQYL